MRGVRVGIGVIALLVASLAQAAPPPSVQVFSTINRAVVAVGETFVLEVEAVVGTAAGDEVRFKLGELDGQFEVVRSEVTGPAFGTFEGQAMTVVGSRFVLRALETGRLDVPAVTVRAGALHAETQPHTLHVYDDASGFYAAPRAVFPIVAEGDGFQRIGSAFLIAEDAVVTAYHVVVGTGRVRIQLPDGQRVTTRKVWALDPVRDVAILELDPEAVRRAGVTPLPLAPPYELGAPGEPAFTAGWPDGVQKTSVGLRYDDLQPAPGETIWVSSNQVRPGDSGGPLLDRQGRVLGVVTSGRTADAGGEFLAEDVCLASDLRRALAQRLRHPRPFKLKDALAVHARADAHARALDLATTITASTRTRGDRDRQRSALRVAATEAPRDPALLFLLGSALEQVGDEAEAAAAYRAALDGDARYFPAAYALGHYYMKTEAYDAAETLFLQTVEDAPYATLAALGLARTYVARLRYAEAETALRTVLQHDQRFAPALYLLAYCHLAQGRRAEAGALLVRLEHLDDHWAERLRLHLRQPVLEPVALAALPPASVPKP